MAPRKVATAAEKKKVERQLDATLSQQVPSVETSRVLTSGKQLLAVPRKKKTLPKAIGLGLLGTMGLIALAIIIHIVHNGKDTTVSVPEGSQAKIGKDGSITVEPPSTQYSVPSTPGIAPPPAVAPFNEKNSKEQLTLRRFYACREPSLRPAVLAAGGGTSQSERAVTAALLWLANHQLADGGKNGTAMHFSAVAVCADPEIHRFNLDSAAEPRSLWPRR